MTRRRHAAPRRRVTVTPRKVRLRGPSASVLVAAVAGIVFGASAVIVGSEPPKQASATAPAVVRVVPTPVATPVPMIVGECAEAVDQAGQLVTEQAKHISDGRQALLDLSNGEWPGEHVAALDTVDQRLSALRNKFYELEKLCHDKVP